MVSRETIALLIRIGSDADREPINEANGIAEIADRDAINRLGPGSWDSATKDLATADLVNLIRGLTASELVHQWIGGSVSATIWTFRILQGRSEQLADELTDWVLARTKNPYVPFGSQNHGAKSLAQYRNLMRARATRARQRLDDEEARKRTAEVEAAIRQEQRQRSSRDRHTEKRKEFIKELESLSLLEQIRRLAADEVYSVEFYPTWIANRATVEELNGLDPTVISILRKKLAGDRRGPWRKFKDLLWKVRD